MITIKNIESRGKYFIVTTDISYKFDLDVISKYNIRVGCKFSPQKFAQILSYQDYITSYNKALKCLEYGDKSIHEMKEYLLSKGSTTIDFVINKLIDLNLLNDKRLAMSILDSHKSTLKGPYYIKQKLSNKGISKDIISDVLKFYSKEEDENNCFVLANKLSNSLSKYPLIKQKEKLYTKLVSYGYGLETVRSIIDKVNFIDESDNTLILELNKLENKIDRKNLSREVKRDYLISKLMSKGFSYKKINELIDK